MQESNPEPQTNPILFGEEIEENKEFLNNFPAAFEDEEKKYFPTLEHFYQFNKYKKTDYIFAEKIRLSKSAEEANQLGNDKNFPKVENWQKIKRNIMTEGLKYKFTQNSQLKELLLSTGEKEFIYQSNNVFWGKNKEMEGENHFSELLVELRDALKPQELGPYAGVDIFAPEKKKRTNQKKKSRAGKSSTALYKDGDGAVAFDMVSSDQVSVTDNNSDQKIIIPMKVIPSKAKLLAHANQFRKKNNPNLFNDGTLDEEEEEDDEYEEGCEEYIFNRADERKNLQATWTTELNANENYEKEVKLLQSMGYTDVDRMLSILMAVGGDLNAALEFIDQP